MRYSDDIIEEVRMKNDIVDVVSQYVKLNKRGSTYFGLCPFHNEKSPSFSVSRQKQMYYCFGCGAGGNVFTFLMEYENFSFVEAVKFLADRAGIELPEMEYSKEAKEKADLKSTILEMNKLAAKYFYVQLKSERGSQAYSYLKNRELSDETITAFGLGFSNKYSDDLYKYLREKGYSEDLTVYAKWEIEIYTINYELNGGTNHKDNPATYTFLDKVTFKNPEKEGYTFEGWYSDPEFKKTFNNIIFF